MIRHLVLCGLGPGHLKLLEHLARQPTRQHADIGISLLTRQRRYISDALLLKTVGRPSAPDLEDHIDRLAQAATSQAQALEAMVQKAGVRWIEHNPQQLDPVTKTLVLDDGRTLRFDWLSIEPEPVQSRDAIDQLLPGARANGLFMHPREAFCKLWPQVQALATKRPLRFAVVLNLNVGLPPSTRQPTATWEQEKFALELVFALQHAFKGSAVTLITGTAAVAISIQSTSPALQACLQLALKKRHITVLPDAACAIAPAEVRLQSGARLACDVPLLLLLGPRAPHWLTSSGLALNAQGQVLTDANLRSHSYPSVFVSDCASSAHPAPTQARRLLRGLRGVMAGRPPVTAASPQVTASPGAPFDATAHAIDPAFSAKNTLHRVNCGDGHSIVAWRQWAFESRNL